MDEARRSERSTHTAARQLALSLLVALRVAGPQRMDGKAGPLRSVSLQRDTGIARSTLRALKNASDEFDPNPDLSTLCRLADALDIPVAFLLMTPKDWGALRHIIINGMADPLRAASRLIGDRDFGGPEMAERVLKECGVHPERPPHGAPADEQEMARMRARDEWRRRTSHVFAALAQRAGCTREDYVTLTALAASLALHTTPNDPDQFRVAS